MKIFIGFIFLSISMDAFAIEKSYLCTGYWETCIEGGRTTVVVVDPNDACDVLYKKTAADLVEAVSCAIIKENGETGAFFKIADRCD